jgi:hypothetical protein
MDGKIDEAAADPSRGASRETPGAAAEEAVPTARPLADAEISSSRRVTRRSLLGSLGLGLGAAAVAVAGGSTTGAAQGPGCTDNDGGQFADPPGGGRSCQPPGLDSGCSDFDGGRYADPPGRGRRCQPRRRATRPTGCTDRDSGPNEDAACAARRGSERQPRPLSAGPAVSGWASVPPRRATRAADSPVSTAPAGRAQGRRARGVRLHPTRELSHVTEPRRAHTA